MEVEEAWHEPIRYYAAQIKGGYGAATAADFIRFLQGTEARAVFEAEGFRVYAP
jgi:ABC-type molybdate transport system substrate-binding protein